mmetsp:Transcript_34640/g.83103  ORF Transcript_34640/g.83103 Transcript_34640/m.83103 type:complete len:202 (+) Transcript_34640:6500-7105(+)
MVLQQSLLHAPGVPHQLRDHLAVLTLGLHRDADSLVHAHAPARVVGKGAALQGQNHLIALPGRGDARVALRHGRPVPPQRGGAAHAQLVVEVGHRLGDREPPRRQRRLPGLAGHLDQAKGQQNCRQTAEPDEQGGQRALHVVHMEVARQDAVARRRGVTGGARPVEVKAASFAPRIEWQAEAQLEGLDDRCIVPARSHAAV